MNKLKLIFLPALALSDYVQWNVVMAWEYGYCSFSESWSCTKVKLMEEK